MTKHRSIRWKLPLVAVVIVLAVLAVAGTALAAPYWSDMAGVAAKYGITDDDVARISSGYPDGTWKPFNNVTRAQFTKMAVVAFGVTLANPATPSYPDVPAGSPFYPYIEGAKAAGLVNGNGDGLFGPNNAITRQQAAAILARYVAQQRGYDLASMTDAQANAILGPYPDGGAVAADLKKAVAFAVQNGILKGNAYGYLAPAGNVTRIAAAAMIIRATGVEPAQARLTGLKLEGAANDVAAEYGAGPVTDYYTTAGTSYLRLSLLDQFGHVYTPSAGQKVYWEIYDSTGALKLSDDENVTGPFVVTVNLASLVGAAPKGTYTFTVKAWMDAPGGITGVFEPTDIKANDLTLTVIKEDARVAKIVLTQLYAGAIYVKTPVEIKYFGTPTNQSYKVEGVVDQAGNSLGLTGLRYLVTTSAGAVVTNQAVSVSPFTWAPTVALGPGAYRVYVWADDGDNTPEAFETQSNAVDTTWTARTVASLAIKHYIKITQRGTDGNFGTADDVVTQTSPTTDPILVQATTFDTTPDPDTGTKTEYIVQFVALDQFGQPITTVTAPTALWKNYAGLSWSATGWPVTGAAPFTAGVHTLQAWYDVNGDGLIGSGELTNALTVTVTGP